jgi:molybdopterin-containing oxidoreductase family iron-sulfur binding subunit
MPRYAMAIDLDRCTGCGACMVACAAENNVPPAEARANPRTGITPLRVYRVSNGESGAAERAAFIPMMCMHCGEHTPCESVCPQQAVELDRATGIVDQMPQRCLGCRYCMTACPYHARYFNWFDPAWPAGMEQTLNPGVAPRTRGVVEKCDFCHARLHAAGERAALEGRKPAAADWTPACVEACPSQAIAFGDLDERDSEIAALARDPQSFRWLVKLGTDPKVYYRSRRPWVRALADQGGAVPRKENRNG